MTSLAPILKGKRIKKGYLAKKKAFLGLRRLKEWITMRTDAFTFQRLNPYHLYFLLVKI
jgi:hypothetical protein